MKTEKDFLNPALVNALERTDDIENLTLGNYADCQELAHKFYKDLTDDTLVNLLGNLIHVADKHSKILAYYDAMEDKYMRRREEEILKKFNNKKLGEYNYEI